MRFLVYWSRSISLVFLRGSPLDRRIPTAIDDELSCIFGGVVDLDLLEIL